MDRRYELDLTRMFACLMVVLLHTAATGWHIDPSLPEWRYYNLADMAARAGVPLFFMLSGALFLNRETLDPRRFFLRRTLRLLLLYAVWSSFYALASLLQYGGGGHDLLRRAAAGHYHLQFLAIQFFLYLLVPVLHSCLHGKKLSERYLLALFGLVLLKENLSLVPNLPDVLQILLDKLNYTYIIYLLYIPLGYWLSRRTYPRGTRAVCLAVYTAVTLLAAWGNRWYSIRQGEPKEWLYGYLCAATVIQAVCIFCFFQTWRGLEVKRPGLLLELSGCTLGVYLFHPFVLETLRSLGISVAMSVPIKSIPFLVFLVLVICLAAVWGLRRIPGIRKLLSS